MEHTIVEKGFNEGCGWYALFGDGGRFEANTETELNSAILDYYDEITREPSSLVILSDYYPATF